MQIIIVYQDYIKNYKINDYDKQTSSILYSLKIAISITRLAQESISSKI